jgi:hypothetical protein
MSLSQSLKKIAPSTVLHCQELSEIAYSPLPSHYTSVWESQKHGQQKNKTNFKRKEKKHETLGGSAGLCGYWGYFYPTTVSFTVIVISRDLHKQGD